MPIQPLSPEKLRRRCDPTEFTFATTAALPPTNTIIGQPRGTRAIAFGIDIQNEGYNIYVTGAHGTGRKTAIQKFLKTHAHEQDPPCDWIYVANFQTWHRPQAIDLPTGQGKQFQEQMAHLVSLLQPNLTSAFQGDVYRRSMDQMQQELSENQDVLFGVIDAEAREYGLNLVQTEDGLIVVALDEEGHTIPFEQLAPETQTIQQTLNQAVSNAMIESQRLQETAHEKMRKLDRQVAEQTMGHHFETLASEFSANDKVQTYLQAVHDDVLANLYHFLSEKTGWDPPDLRRYQVNLLVDHTDTQGRPVIIEKDPTYHNLVGRLEYEMNNGMMLTHFTNIKGGSLHQANGGYLIIDAYELLEDYRAWEALRRILLAQEIRIQSFAMMEGNQLLAKSLDPEPIPLDIKVILVGGTGLYYSLYETEEEFRSLFKVRADFSVNMSYTAENVQEYAHFVATLCHQEKLCHFTPKALAKIVEYSCALAGDQHKLSTQFGKVADLVREASYWARKAGREMTTEADVATAVRERIYRVNRIEEDIRQQVLDNTVFIHTDGDTIGQINGLSVFDYGDHEFGQASRVTVHTYMGSDGITHIERETDMSGPMHQKGLLSLMGYLGGQYGRKQPLSFKASITFEQNYGPIDGDSASSTELFALLSSLGQLPIKQGIAVTGSVNQLGEIQPIGGVNEKIEGFFRLCKARGLTGEQGVIIPYANARNLMLEEEVLTAVNQQQFNVWAIRTIDEGAEILMGLPAGTADADGQFPDDTVHGRVKQRLRKLAEELNAFGNDNRDNDDDSDDEEE